MKPQSYKNHIRYYTPHHFVFYPVLLVLLIISIVFIFKRPADSLVWSSVAVLLVLIGGLSFMTRQHYALNNQNRIVRLEMRLRYYQLSNKKFDEIENRISFSQLAALRFAPDEELLSLIQQTLERNLSADQIKRSIKNWNPDTMRV